MTKEFKILSYFAEGKIIAKDFEQELYNNIQLQEILSDEIIIGAELILNKQIRFCF